MVVVLALLATVWITWPLWNVRTQPHLLPAFDLPQISLGAPLIGACLAAILAPRAGTIAVILLVAYGMATDQTRMQPEFISLPILLWGSLPSRSARLIARTHLTALWFFAGLHKLLGTDFIASGGPQVMRALPLQLPEHIMGIAVLAIALGEIATALLAIIPVTREISAWSALALHAGILVAISSHAAQPNIAVWPWNIALAFSGFALIAPWATSIFANWLAAPVVPRVVVAALAFAPLGYYAGVVDAYPAHNLYSSGTARATIYCPAGCRPEQDINATWHKLNVPLPPEPRLYLASFAKNCAAGDVIRIENSHSPPWARGRERRILGCPGAQLPASHP